MTSLTPAQLKVSVFFAALLWFASVIESNFYLMVIIPWAAFMLLSTWKQKNPHVAIFEEKAEPVKAAPAAEAAETPQA